MWGFAAIAVFMSVYYMLFGLISVTALAANLLFLVHTAFAFASHPDASGIAAIALTLGMAIDANRCCNWC